MHLESHQLLLLLQWSDSAFPTGAFAHSGGLETYTQNGQIKNIHDLAHFIQVRLENAAATDFILLHVAHAAYSADNFPELIMLDELCHAMKLARETRQASERVGRRMLENVLMLMPEARLKQFRASIESGRGYGHHPVVYGAACAELGLEARAALLAFGFGMVANQASAALKLMAIGQSQAQLLIHKMQPIVINAAEAALTRTVEDLGGFAPALEIRAMQHETLFRRLFIS